VAEELDGEVWVPGRAGQGYAKERKKRPKVRAHESDEEDEGEEEEEAEIESGRGGGGKAPKARGKGPLGKILARIGGDIEYKCGRCGGVVRERTWKSHREKKKACLAANAGEMLFRVKLEAPPPAPPRTAQTFSGDFQRCLCRLTWILILGQILQNPQWWDGDLINSGVTA
jgi:phage FluMu protein Com